MPIVTLFSGTATAFNGSCTSFFARLADVCLSTSSPNWDSTARTTTFVITGIADSTDESIETFSVKVSDSSNSSQRRRDTTLINVNLSEKVTSECRVQVRARYANRTIWHSTAVIAAGKSSGKATVRHNDDDIWQDKGYYNMPVWVAPGNCYQGQDESNTTYIIQVIDDGDPRPNRPPVFPRPKLILVGNLLENSAGGTNVLPGISTPVATDPDGDTLTYTLERAENAKATDPDAFVFNPDTNRITTKSGVIYDYETQRIYALESTANDGRGGTDFLDIFIHLTDVAEPPPAPVVTSVTPTTGSNTSLNVSWTAPDNTGKPDINSYDLRYRVGSSGTWTNGPQDVTGTSSQIIGLYSGATYQVQVRATNDEGNGGWSSAGPGTTSGTSLPTVFWRFSTASTAENGGTTSNAWIRATRDVVSALTVNYSLSGTATCGTDYTITGTDCTTGTGAFTLPANTSALSVVTFPITITPDDISDNGETIIMTITAGDGYNVSSPAVYTLTIYDDTGSAAFSLSGTPQVGETLTIVKDSDDPDGNGTRSFLYIWFFRATSSDDWDYLQALGRGCGDGTTTCTPTHSEQYPTVGGYFRAAATYTDGNGLPTTVTTNAIGPMTLPPPGIVLPTADMTLREGSTASYNVKLATDPGDGATVRVSITSSEARG